MAPVNSVNAVNNNPFFVKPAPAIGVGGTFGKSGKVNPGTYTTTGVQAKASGPYAKYEQYDLKRPELRDAEHGQNLYMLG